MMRFALVLGVSLCVVAPVLAEPEPRGPADLVSGARKARDARELKEAGNRAASAGEPEAAPTGAPAEADPHADGDGHGHEDGEAPIAARLSDERPDPSLPNGTIRVHVRDPQGQPVNDADIELAIMGSDSTRTTRSARSKSDGEAMFTGLTGGDRQAYRVNVLHEGAKYSSTPFRLPLAGGYDVEIRRLPVTQSDRMVVTYVGATSIELKDDRMRVVQQTRLMNVGRETYVFPKEGKLVALPPGFMAFQTQESMTDQHVTEATGEGLRVRGSLPPGEATLLWAFDLPISGTSANIGIDLPWVVFTYRVITDAPPGLQLRVEGMPAPEEHRDQGRRYWVTETQRRVGDAPFRRVEIALKGIPGQGNARWIAAVLAFFAVVAGAFAARRLPDRRANRTSLDLETYKSDVLDRARQLDGQHRSGEIGPEYHREQMAALEDELAELLYEQAQAKAASGTASTRSGARA